MRELIMKLLGLNSLVNQVDLLRKENEELKKELAELAEKVDEIEVPDMDDYVSENDINDRIESFLYDNDYVNKDWVQSEMEEVATEKVEEAINDLDLTDKVKEVVKEMDKASFGDTEEMTAIVKQSVKEFVLNRVSVNLEVR